MGRYLNPTNKGFEIARNSKIYVDKTGLIKYTNSVLDTEQRFICVSRPRRFGKSMAAQMLLAYYCSTCNSSELFHGLEIENDDSFRCHLNQYDVLFLDMQRFLSRAKSPKELIAYLQKVVISELREVYADCVNPEETELAAALEDIAEKAKKEFIFIIDEWDCVFRETKDDAAAQKSYLDFLEMQKWYDGYKLRNAEHMYNPKSVVDALLNKEFHSYWTGTETYEALKVYMDMNFDGLKDSIIEMLGNGRYKINYRKFQNDMTTFKSRDDVLTLLVHLGYLAYDEETKEVFIPNMEIFDEFQNAIEGEGWDTILKKVRKGT